MPRLYIINDNVIIVSAARKWRVDEKKRAKKAPGKPGALRSCGK
jgi:hypothetical protein